MTFLQRLDSAAPTAAFPTIVREPEEIYRAAKPRLLDRVRDAIRTRHYSRRTEEAYVAWIRRFILFHGKRHPGEMGICSWASR